MRSSEYEGKRLLFLCLMVEYGIGGAVFVLTAFSTQAVWMNNVYSLQFIVPASFLLGVPLLAAKIYFIDEQRDLFWPIRILACWGLGVVTAGLGIGAAVAYRAWM